MIGDLILIAVFAVLFFATNRWHHRTQGFTVPTGKQRVGLR